MSSETKTKNNSSLTLNRMMGLNNLLYSAIGDVSSVKNRITRVHRSETNSYTQGSTTTFNLNVGDHFVYGPNSYLKFSVQTTLTGGTAGKTLAWRKGGSASDLIEQCSLIKNDVIERIEDCNLLARFNSYYNFKNDELYEGMLTAEGFVAPTDGVNVLSEDLTTAAVEFCIPMHRLQLGTFSNSSQLIPSQLLNNARIEIRWAPATVLETFTIADGKEFVNDHTTLGYTISDPELVFDEMSLYDSVLLEISKKASSKDGLIFNYSTYDHISFPVTSSNVVNEVGIPVSHALSVVTILRDTAKIIDVNEDTFAAENVDSTYSYRWLLGSVSYPEDRITSVKEAYMETQKSAQSSISYSAQKKNNVSVAQFSTGGKGALIQSLERSHMNSLSGTQLTGSRVLSFDIRDSAYSTPLTCDNYLMHVRSVSVFNNGKVSVKQ